MSVVCFSALVCITESITEQFQDAMFSPGDIMAPDMAMFYTTLAVYPEVNNLKVGRDLCNKGFMSSQTKSALLWVFTTQRAGGRADKPR